MYILVIIALIILGTSLLLLTCMGLYTLWFMAFPDFIKNIKKTLKSKRNEQN